METTPKDVRERLIRTGLEELNSCGPQKFSVRRVAERCGVSCAAPYKHFKDKNDFLAAIITYANSLWAERQREVVRSCPDSTREQLVQISMAYIHFLVENPYFRSALMLKDEAFDNEHLHLRGDVSQLTRKLITRYCAEVGMPERVELVKTFIVRSLIYGAALMLDNGELPNTPDILEEVAQVIDREFDLPGTTSATALGTEL